ncbi:MAG: GMC family oxidoreductase [Gaiellales bacterium]
MADEFDHVVVGSGAGGGPLAVRLARGGRRVLLLEAGGDAEDLSYRIPVMHGFASEDESLSWRYFVNHYADQAQARRDTKYDADHDGIFYPRAGTLGGCTAHNAMITVDGAGPEWDAIAELTGDRSFAGSHMRSYFQRLERCCYRDRPWTLRWKLAGALARRSTVASWLLGNRGRHGFDGWLSTQEASPGLAIHDQEIIDMVLAAVEDEFTSSLGGRPLEPWEPLAYADPNDWRVQKHGLHGLWLVPLATARGCRNGTREAILATAQELPDRLVVRTDALATRVLFEGARAVGVEYVEQPSAYRADPRARGADPLPSTTEVRCRSDVIVSAGAFNTPQLLMLSGLGPADELGRHGIDVRVDLPGVGENLQDRYEVGVVSKLNRRLELLHEGCTFKPPQPGQKPDPCLDDWKTGNGVYTSNGAVVAIVRRSSASSGQPDLFIFGLPADFRGYKVGYAPLLERHRDRFTWAILKARTANTAGTVRLRSADPRDTPVIDFRYFEEGNDAAGDDLRAVVDGIGFVRGLLARLGHEEEWPGDRVAGDDAVAEWVRNEAWGHHASCSCRMGRPDDPMAVVDSRFRVRGTRNLRVVDASVFPRIPGFFIVTPTYMLSEKAADAVLADRLRQ